MRSWAGHQTYLSLQSCDHWTREYKWKICDTVMKQDVLQETELHSESGQLRSVPFSTSHPPSSLTLSPNFMKLIKCYSILKVKVAQSCPTLCDPMDYTVRGILQARILEWVAFPFSRGASQPSDWTQVSLIIGCFFTSWATREAQNTGVGSLSLLQWIFPTQESNQDLLHCRWILYQLSYQRSPNY